MNNKKGFTLIELLVVIGVIGILAGVILVSLSSARAKSRDSRRKQDLVQVRTALELYFSTNGIYPSTSSGWFGACSGFGGYSTTGAGGYVPSLAPTYIPILPSDPKPKAGNTLSCYAYNSNGVDYKLLAHDTPENPSSGSIFIDPNPTRSSYAWGVWTPGASAW